MIMRYLISSECFQNCHDDDCRHVPQTINMNINCTALKNKNAWRTINQICLRDKLYINYSYEAVPCFPADNSKIICFRLEFIFQEAPLYVTLSPCNYAYAKAEEEHSVYSSQLSPEMQRFPIESFLWWCSEVSGGALPCCYASSLKLLC